MRRIASRSAYMLFILFLSSVAVFYSIRLSGGDATAARMPASASPFGEIRRHVLLIADSVIFAHDVHERLDRLGAWGLELWSFAHRSGLARLGRALQAVVDGLAEPMGRDRHDSDGRSLRGIKLPERGEQV